MPTAGTGISLAGRCYSCTGGPFSFTVRSGGDSGPATLYARPPAKPVKPAGRRPLSRADNPPGGPEGRRGLEQLWGVSDAGDGGCGDCAEEQTDSRCSCLAGLPVGWCTCSCCSHCCCSCCRCSCCSCCCQPPASPPRRATSACSPPAASTPCTWTAGPTGDGQCCGCRSGGRASAAAAGT